MRRPLFLTFCLRAPLAGALFSPFDGNELLGDASDGLLWELPQRYDADMPNREVGATNPSARRFESVQEPFYYSDEFHGTLASDESSPGFGVNQPLGHVDATGSMDPGTSNSTAFFSLPTISYHAEEYFSRPETGEAFDSSLTSSTQGSHYDLLLESGASSLFRDTHLEASDQKHSNLNDLLGLDYGTSLAVSERIAPQIGCPSNAETRKRDRSAVEADPGETHQSNAKREKIFEGEVAGLFSEIQVPEKASRILDNWWNVEEGRCPTTSEQEALSTLTHLPSDSVSRWFSLKLFSQLDSGSNTAHDGNLDELHTVLNVEIPDYETQSFPPDAEHLSIEMRGFRPEEIQQQVELQKFGAKRSTQGLGQQNPAPDLPRARVQITLAEFSMKCLNSNPRQKFPKGPFECTSGCGARYLRKDNWKRHEETNQPQELWSCSACQGEHRGRPFETNRRDRLVAHVKAKHKHVVLPYILESSRVDLDPLIKPCRCGFCGHNFQSWGDRINHLGDHFLGKLEGGVRTMAEWRDPWPEDSLGLSSHLDDNDDNDNELSPFSYHGMKRLVQHQAPEAPYHERRYLEDSPDDSSECLLGVPDKPQAYATVSSSLAVAQPTPVPGASYDARLRYSTSPPDSGSEAAHANMEDFESIPRPFLDATPSSLDLIPSLAAPETLPEDSHLPDTLYKQHFQSELMEPETRPISQEQLVKEVRDIYAGLAMVERRCIMIDEGKQKLDDEQWQTLIAWHRTLLNDHHDLFLASPHPSERPAFRGLAARYAMPARMWRHGVHGLIELLPHRRYSGLYLIAFAYLSRAMIALLREDEKVQARMYGVEETQDMLSMARPRIIRAAWLGRRIALERRLRDMASKLGALRFSKSWYYACCGL